MDTRCVLLAELGQKCRCNWMTHFQVTLSLILNPNCESIINIHPWLCWVLDKIRNKCDRLSSCFLCVCWCDIVTVWQVQGYAVCSVSVLSAAANQREVWLMAVQTPASPRHLELQLKTAPCLNLN